MTPARYFRLCREASRKINRGQVAQAARDLERALKYSTDDGHVWGELAYCRLQQRQYPAAIEAYQKARDLGGFRTGVAALSIAQAYTQSGDLPNGLTWIERALQDGLEDRGSLMDEPLLSPLRDNERFRTLTGQLPPGERTRE